MTTNLDLYLSAQKAAVELLPVEGSHNLHRAAQVAFDKDGNDPEDWDFWFLHFTQQRNHYTGLKQQPSVSEQIKARKAKEEAAKPQAPKGN